MTAVYPFCSHPYCWSEQLQLEREVGESGISKTVEEEQVSASVVLQGNTEETLWQKL